VIYEVFTLASDAEPIREIALSGRIARFRVQRSEEIEKERALLGTFHAVKQRAEVADLSDEMLMDLVRVDDSGAVDVLFNRYSRLVYSIALRILRDAGEAEDVVLESFLYLFRKATMFEPARGSAKVWIVQIAYSRARDRKAHLIRRRFYRHTDIEADGTDQTTAVENDWERRVEARVDFTRLHSAFDELTQNQRETIRLYYFDDLDLREISERLSEPLGNVRHYFYRGLERLRKSVTAERLRKYGNGKN
jgi:RNA polymerase sigma-70 factor, ECF subfamily